MRHVSGLILNLVEMAVKINDHMGVSKERKQPELAFIGGRRGKGISVTGG